MPPRVGGERENLLEDQSMMDQAKAGMATGSSSCSTTSSAAQQSSISPHFELIKDESISRE
jgi:hypothetical protein